MPYNLLKYQKFLLWIGLLISLLFCLWLSSFFYPPQNKSITFFPNPYPEKPRDSVIYSFAFIGCNRVDMEDLNNPMATDSSTANRYVLKRIFNEVAKEKPNALFLLGDIVFGLRSTLELDRSLYHWKKHFEDPQFSRLSGSDIEVILVPGNHEQLYYRDVGVKGHFEWPLKEAQSTWIKHLGGYLPKDRDYISGKDSIEQQSTFSFVRQNTAFIVMNTDTYVAPTPDHPYGLEGQIISYRQNSKIEHIFILGHKPYYIFDIPFTGHSGLPQGKALWETMKKIGSSPCFLLISMPICECILPPMGLTRSLPETEAVLGQQHFLVTPLLKLWPMDKFNWYPKDLIREPHTILRLRKTPL